VLQRADPVLQRADPVLQRADPVLQRADLVLKRTGDAARSMKCQMRTKTALIRTNLG
jgi:hypothetical protein